MNALSLKNSLSSKNTLDSPVDISTITVDSRLPVRERLRNYIGAVGNPYRYRVHDMKVNLEFGESNITLQERLERLIDG